MLEYQTDVKSEDKKKVEILIRKIKAMNKVHEREIGYMYVKRNNGEIDFLILLGISKADRKAIKQLCKSCVKIKRINEDKILKLILQGRGWLHISRNIKQSAGFSPQKIKN